jgi:hypothetical protein
MILRPQVVMRRERDSRSEGRSIGSADRRAVFSCLRRSQYQPPTGANGKYRIGADGGASASGCVGLSGGISNAAGGGDTFMIGRLLLGGDENRGKRTQEKRAQEVRQR